MTISPPQYDVPLLAPQIGAARAYPAMARRVRAEEEAAERERERKRREKLREEDRLSGRNQRLLPYHHGGGFRST